MGEQRFTDLTGITNMGSPEQPTLFIIPDHQQEINSAKQKVKSTRHAVSIFFSSSNDYFLCCTHSESVITPSLIAEYIQTIYDTYYHGHWDFSPKISYAPKEHEDYSLTFPKRILVTIINAATSYIVIPKAPSLPVTIGEILTAIIPAGYHRCHEASNGPSDVGNSQQKACGCKNTLP